MYTLLGTQAIEHLFRVSTGLDSMLIGEAEILGQVKDAYVQAQRARSLGKTLHALFREALEAGKDARTQTAIAGDSTSSRRAAVALREAARRRPARHSRCSSIGAGKMGALAARRLQDEGAARYRRAEPLAQARARRRRSASATVRAPPSCPVSSNALENADVVVTSTGASHFVLTPGNVARSDAARAPIARCSSSTSRCRATPIPTSRESRASASSTSTAQGRRRRHAREAPRSDPDRRRDHRRRTPSASRSGISRASRCP